MTSDIPVSHLSKHYQVHQKEPGFTGSLRSFFRRQYQTVRAVDDVTFTIKPGEIVGFLGPNGAGKTTTLKVLSGLLYPTSGEVNVCGFPMATTLFYVSARFWRYAIRFYSSASS